MKLVIAFLAASFIGGFGLLDLSDNKKEHIVSDEYQVRISFLIYAEEANKYPVTYKAFLSAISEWACHLPIDFTLVVDTELAKTSDGKLIKYPRLCEIHIGDITELIGAPPSYLGVWFNTNKTLYLDSKDLESNSILAYNVALHELGHLFGLPHIVGREDILFNRYILTGDLLVDGSAINWIMFPFDVGGNSMKIGLTEIEKKIAKNYLLNIIGTVGILSPHGGLDKCCLEH